MSDFIHLHTHSHYSLLSALPKLPELVGRAKKYKMPALALTDAGNMYGAIEFYKECNKQEIKPIIGVDFYVALRSRLDKQAGVDNRRYRLVLLAKDLTGYKNLMTLVSEAGISGFYYKPRIDHEIMAEHADGVVAILPSFSSEISAALKAHDDEKAHSRLKFYKDTYGEENLFIEVTHHPEIEGHSDLMERLVAFAKQTDTKIVGAHDVYYLDPSDKKARDTLLSVQSSGFSKGGFTDENEDFSFITAKQAEKNFKHIPEAVANTRLISEMCNLELDFSKWYFPDFKIPKNTTYKKELDRLTQEGLAKRGMKVTPEVQERLDFELSTINTKGYAPYFLVVGDLLHHAHEHDIPTTIRGSVAGSLVTYLVGITNVDPLEYLLPFERFLNPFRPSAPDIDMDFADNRRDEMIQYARDKYGAEKVAQIGTFGTMMARGSVRDTTRALGFPYELGDAIAKLIPMGSQGFPMTIERALKDTAELRDLIKKDERVKEIIDMAQKIEGCARHISVHAAGVVIAPDELTAYTPLQVDQKSGKLITQYDMRSVDEGGAGLLKFDFLGLKNLSILADTVKRIKWRKNEKIDIEEIPLDDAKTFTMLAEGETMGVFQLAGGAMTKYLKDLKPTSIHDINAMVALYRPGPMNNIPEYIARKQGKSPIRYMHPKMESFLDKSYGILVYQDDLLFTALELAGYDWKEVDKFRKAVGKKIPEEMAKQHVKFVEGCQKHSNMTEAQAEKLWDLFEPFQGYGFNKAHAASYGKVAYQTAYMKANYPYEYMAAILTADSGDTDKIHAAISECTRMGIDILPPSINESFGTFTIVEDDGVEKIRFGLYTIKNFGEGIADVIIEERKKNGKFDSIAGLLDRVRDRNLNKKSLEALIKCGALDDFGERGQLLANVEGLLKYAKENASKPADQDSLFGLMADSSTVPTLTLKDSEPASMDEKLAWEKDLLGLYLSGHPLDPYKERLMGRDMTIEKIKEATKPGITVVVAGIVEDARPIRTRKGDEMAFIRMADFTGTIEVVAFPKVYDEFKTLLQNDTCIAIKGHLSHRNDEISVIAEAVKTI